MTLQEIIQHFQNAKQVSAGQYAVNCPACGDTKRHLYITERDGKILLDCKKGCAFNDIVQASGIRKSEFFPPKPKTERWTKLREHIYTDTEGNPLARKTLYDKGNGSKTAVWERYENGTYIKKLNGLKVPPYRCVRDNPRRLKFKLQYVLNSREDFRWIAYLHKRGLFPRFHDYDRAAKFYQLIRCSYASSLDSFAGQPHSMWADFPIIDMASKRLQKVVVENQDFEVLIKHYDSSVSFFYCDPPYYATESYYKDVGFTKKDHIRLRDTLIECKGKFLVSYNDCAEIRELWDMPGIRIESISRLNNLLQRYKGGSMYDEVFISNYDTREKINMNRQLSLWDDDVNGGVILQ